MPIEAGDFKTGLTLVIEGDIFQVLDFQHVKPGKGAAILKTKLKNLRTGGVLERNFATNIKFEQAMIEKRDLQYSYNADTTYYFMDMETFETYELSEDMIGYGKNFLIEGQLVTAKFYEAEILTVDLPEKIEMVVAETTDAVPGNTATNATKDAVLETGFVVRVPLFIKQGETIVINTNDGKYCGRA